MAETLQRLLGISLVLFMAGNLLDMGLKLHVRDALTAIRNRRFVMLSLVWSFGLCPALAYVLATVVPMEEPYAVGLLFLGLAPGAPFLPAVAEKARGDIAYVAAFMLLTAVGTVIFMPLGVPLLVKSFHADAWTTAKPLVLYIALPLAVGIAIRAMATPVAEKTQPAVRRITAVATLVMLILIALMYGRDFLHAIGSFAIGSQILFYLLVMAGSYALGWGLRPEQKSVLALGLCTRNIGAAVAPLFAVAGTDRRAIVMCALAVPVTVIVSLMAAGWFARRSPVAAAK